MKEFLTNIRPPKFIRYLFFIGYSWYRGFKSERDDAHFTTVIMLSLPLFLLPFIVNSIQFVCGYKDMVVFPKASILLFALITGVIQYWLFIYNSKWKLYIKEFEYVKKFKRKIGLIYLFIYLFISLILALFPFLLDMIFDVNLLDK